MPKPQGGISKQPEKDISNIAFLDSTNTEEPRVFPNPSGIQREPIRRAEEYHSLSQADTSNMDRMIEAVCGQLALSRLPVIEPDVFDGRDLLSFPIWKLSFDALVDHRAMSATDRLNLLSRFLDGEAKAAVKGYLMLPPGEAYGRAYKLLNERYGDNFKLANTYKDRLRKWPRLGGMDASGLRKFVDFLEQCRTAKLSYPALRVLDDEAENTELTKKLPAWLSRQWSRKVVALREATGEFPDFDQFVEFVQQEDRIAHDPFTKATQGVEGAKDRSRGTSFALENREFAFAGDTAPNGKSFGACTFCSGKHSIEICRKFGAETVDKKQKFIYDNRLCFGCLVKGHISRECRNRRVCQICQGYHPTSMHRGDSEPEGSSAAISNYADTESIGYSHRIMAHQAQSPPRRRKGRKAKNL